MEDNKTDVGTSDIILGNAVVTKIIKYVDSLGGEESNNFVFGNIAFSKEGDNNINIGSKLIFGNYFEGPNNKQKREKLEAENIRFGDSLNSMNSYSITKYLQLTELGCFELHLCGSNKKLLLHPLELEEPVKEPIFKHGVFSFNEFMDYAPRYDKNYIPDICKENIGDNQSIALQAFNMTINYYAEFHNIVVGENEGENGYIYLIRSSNVDELFSALAYMYLKSPLDKKDIEIIRYYLGSHFLELLKNKARIESIKSAKAAIMSRNISHNLGSHVMAYMKHDLSSVEDMLNNGVLREACPSDTFPKDIVKGKEIPYLVGIGRFISYLQERQDYIATVSTDFIPYPSVVNFKDSIYDELNPDYRFQRHTEWTGHKPANILLENIAKSEGLSRKRLGNGVVQDQNNIIIRYGDFDGLNTDNKDYDKLRDWNFSLPGGIMGRQAIFSIVENVIRNAAKHSTRKNGDNLIITFDIIDPLEENYNEADYNTQDIRDLYIVKLTTNTRINEEGLKKIQAAIEDDLIEPNGKLKQSNKGIKEMLISAAWLRGIKIEELKDEQIRSKAPILRAKDTDKGELQYVFCLPKVKELAIITKSIKEEKLNDTVRGLMRAKGWYIFNDDDSYLACPNKDFSFIIIDPALCTTVKNEDGEFIVATDGSQERKRDTKDRIKEKSHNRYFVASEKETNLSSHLIKTNLIKTFPKDKDVSAEQAKYFFDNEMLKLYEQLAKCDDDDRIVIADTDFIDKYMDEKSNRVELVDDVIDRIKGFKYIYRKHNDTAKEFNDLVKGYGIKNFFDPSKLWFVEGITGGNSTDRLVRHMVLDDLWAYKQIYAMKTRVAIFDERIFTKVTGLETTNLASTQAQTKGWTLDDCEGDVEEAKKKIYNYDKNHGKRLKNELYKEYKRLKSIKEIQEFADKNLPLPITTSSSIDSVNSMIFHKKGIDVFTITWKEEGIFQIWGFVPDEELSEKEDYGKVMPIMELTIDPNGASDPAIKMIRDGYSLLHYDYLSIHQGLLDKVYDSFERKVSDTDNHKKKVTKALHDKFLIPCVGDDHLQGLVIHSGRSKPNEESMPQHQPFVQYSAVENAVFDCKYTLVELLDFACFD